MKVKHNFFFLKYTDECAEDSMHCISILSKRLRTYYLKIRNKNTTFSKGRSERTVCSSPYSVSTDLDIGLLRLMNAL